MKRKILCILLLAALVIGLLPQGTLSVNAYSDTDIAYTVEGGNLYFDKETGTITDCDESVTKADIPAQIEGVAVTSIGDSAFECCGCLTSVTIPDSVTSIGDQAFNWCISLTSVTIPDGVTSIGDSAFDSCSSLISIYIPDSVTSIGDWAFWGCSSLTSINIPDSVTSIGEGAFSDCSSLTEISVAEDNTAYTSENGVLFDKAKTTLLAYPADKPKAEYAIPDSVTSIGTYAFFCCDNLTDITIPSSVTGIGEDAFGWSGLTSIHIPDSVTSIGERAFRYCISLTNVTIPDSVTSIGEGAFYGCNNLQAVYFMGNAPALGDAAFKMWDEETNTEINLPALTLYYIEGKEDWTSPTWNGYPTATWAPAAENSYTDVSEKEWYFDAVQYATQNGLMNGVGNGKFDPEGSMTRAMLVTVLWRYEGEPAGGENIFTDVPNGTWYTDAVAWAAEKGIVGGIGNGKFDPEGNITREQMATILFRYAQKKCINTSKRGDLSGFADSGNVSSWAKDAVQWTVAEGIINGSDGKLLPQGNATRAQVSAILMRFIKNIAEDKFDTSGHTEVIDPAVPATCTESGLTEGKRCSVCGTVLIAQETVDALGHDYGEWTQTKEPTCTEKGEEKRVCSRCDAFEVREIAAHGHTEIVDAAVPATCTEAGKTEGKHCSVCGTVLVAQETIDALGHDYGAWTQTKEPTCTEKGEEKCTCSRCDAVETRKIAALGHDYGEWTQTKEPTCTEKGEERRVCSRCDNFEMREIAAHGHTEIVDAAVPATCTEAGKTEGKHCSVCGTVLIAQETVDALGHDYGAWTQVKAPTCTEKGEEKRVCSRCDAFETREIAAHGHTEIVDAAIPATCTEKGKTEGKHCSACGTVLVAQETVDALGHDYGAWTQVKAPTCTEKGEEKHTCSRCDAFETRELSAKGHTEVIDPAVAATCTEAGKTEGKHCSVCGTVLVAQETVDALGHDYGDWTQTKEPTCTEKGEEKRVCSRCDIFDTREIAALGHNFDAWTQTKAPTCIEQGEEERDCSRCGFFETRELDVTDHTEVIDPAVAATCTEAGKTEGKHCSVCGTVLVAQETVDALGHDYGDWTQMKAPTCTEKGEEKRVCSRCDAFETRELDVTDHTEVIDPAVAATCTEAGKTEGKHCSVCKTVIVAQEEIPALGHNYGTWTQVKAPTCTEKGEEKRVCSRCDIFDTREIAALGHNFDAWTQTKAPTCIEQGEEERDCSRCGFFETRELDVTDHTEVIDPAVAATCTEAGKTEGKHCSVCGTVLVAQETVDALGHDYGDWTQTKEPTCTEKGEEKHTCSRCDAFETRELDVTDHTEVIDPAVAATCTEAGKTEGKHCSVCGTVLVAQETVDALGHDYGDWTQTKEPTCTEKGEEKRTCSRCDAFETRELDIVDPKHVVTAGTRKMYIGMSSELLLEYAGEPEEILSTTSGYTWYVYGTETYTDFVMAGVYENKVVAICASGADFSYRGCTAYGSVAEAEEGDTYYISILKDKTDNSAVYGILLTDNKFRVQYAATEAALAGESRVAFHMANAFRVLHDASILEWCDNAATAARLHCEDMATQDYVSHTSADGRLFYMRLKENGVLYRHCAENLCAGYYSGLGAHNAWVNSSGHRANLLSDNIDRCGVGFAYGADSYYRYYAVTDYYHTK